MQRKKRHYFRNSILAVLSFALLSNAQAATPLWTFVPQTPTAINIAKGNSAQVIYTVKNQSTKVKTLVMKPIPGVTQVAPCQLSSNGSCTLTLNVNGSNLQGDISGGPVLCQQGNNLQCYQPSQNNTLSVRLITEPPIQQFTITPSANANGSISPATPQVVTAGTSLVFTATPDSGFGVNEWLLDGSVVQSGGTSFQLNNIQTNHSVAVTFGQATLSPLTHNLSLSINSPAADPALTGNPRIIRIENTGSIAAQNVTVTVGASGLPPGTVVNFGTCTGTLNAGATCDITITPGGTASHGLFSTTPCNTPPGDNVDLTQTPITVSADNVSSTTVHILILGYGCIYQGGAIFSIDDTTPDTGSIGGKESAILDEPATTYQWATVLNDTTADSITDGFANTNALATPIGNYPAAQACLDKNSPPLFDDGWYLPSICELGRSVVSGTDAGCGTTNPNLYTTLYLNNLGFLQNDTYWSSSEDSANPVNLAWTQFFNTGFQGTSIKTGNRRIRCVRAFTP